MSFQWVVTPEQAFGDMTRQYVAAIRRGVREIANRRAPEIAAWMQANAPWQDITGMARETLNTEVEELADDMVSILLQGGVDYFVYLELSNGGRFAIIAPAIDHWGPVVWNDVQAMLS